MAGGRRIRSQRGRGGKFKASRRRKTRSASRKRSKRNRMVRRDGTINPFPGMAIMRKVAKQINLIPTKRIRQLKYCQMIQLNPGPTGHADNHFRVNSLFDPDSSGTGRSPRFFNEYMDIYDSYTVLKSRIKVSHLSDRGEIHSQTLNTNLNPGVYGVYLDTKTNDIEGILGGYLKYIEGLSELKMSYSTYHDPYGKHRNHDKPQRAKWALGAMRHLDDTTLEGDANTINDLHRYTGGATSNPLNGPSYKVFAATLDGAGSADPDNVNLMVEIWYTVMFTDPKFEQGS